MQQRERPFCASCEEHYVEEPGADGQEEMVVAELLAEDSLDIVLPHYAIQIHSGLRLLRPSTLYDEPDPATLADVNFLP